MFSLDINNKKTFFVLIIALIIFALFLRVVPPLDKHGLNGMEIDYIFWAKNLSGYDFLVNCVANHHGFLSPLLLKLWLSLPIIKNIDFHTRLLSLIFFVLLLLSIYKFRPEWIDNKILLLSMFFISINGMMIAFSRNARLLPLFALLIYLSIVFFNRNIKETKLTNAILLFIFSFLSLINHPLSLLFLGGVLFSAIVLYGLNRKIIKSSLPLLFSFVFYLPLLIWYFQWGKVEEELLRLDKKIISKWFVWLFDDIDTIFILIVPLFFVNISDSLNKFKEAVKSDIVKFFTLILLSGFLIIVIISIFVPLTRTYYIIPLIILSSFLGASYVSLFKRKVVIMILVVISLKAIVSYSFLEKTVRIFPSSYGVEKELMINFRESNGYKNLEKNGTLFINIPLLNTRVFNFYKLPEEKYFPFPNRFGYIEELINYENLKKLSTNYNAVVILWNSCERLMTSSHKLLCEKNMKIIKDIYGEPEILKILKDIRGNEVKILFFKKSNNLI